MLINENLFKINSQNSFLAATEVVKNYKASNPGNKVISLSIGDVSFPVASHIAKKMIEAVNNEANENYVGYGNQIGIPALIKAIQQNEYPSFSLDEIYVSDGTKSDAGNLLELFDQDALIGIYEITYPIYENSVKSLGRKFEYIPVDNNFLPTIPKNHFDVIYLCSPNNPTGINYDYKTLKKIIDYANRERCVIICDNVYFKFIENGVKSIYEVEGARSCAIEMRSFSKHASFTGIRCSYYVIPNELHNGINAVWKSRTINRFNGASYIAQIGALASFDAEATVEIEENLKYYKNNAKYLATKFKDLGYKVYGSNDAPYLWISCKNNKKSWDLFLEFLQKIEVVIVPGIIFGESGNDYFRVSALGKYEDVVEAMRRIEEYEKK